MRFLNNMLSYLFLLLVVISAKAYAIESPIVEDIIGDAANTQGELTYSIPLILPKTLHGIQPNVVLSYNQSRGLSNVGVGFSLALTEKIGRCSPKKLSHGNVGGVEVGEHSIYCLGGNVLVKQADGSYRKYLDDNTKIIINSGSHSKPSEWEVYDQQGFKYTYGFEAGFSEITRSWLLTKKQDIFSNEVAYEYGNSQELKKIRYPGYVLDIDYNDEDKKPQVYAGGKIIDQIGPISHFKISTENDVFLYEYVFGYESTTGYKTVVSDRLSTLKRCYSENEANCTDPKKFKYREYIEPNNELAMADDRTVVITDSELDASKFSGNDGLFLGISPVDLDDDGVDEFCFYSKADQLLCRSGAADSASLKIYASGFGYSENGLNKFLRSISGEEAEHFKRLNFVDLNDDNKEDLCLVVGKEVRCALYDEMSQIFGKVTTWKTGVNADNYYQFTDVTKDGIVDFCSVQPGKRTLNCYQNNGTGFGKTVVSFDANLDSNRSYSYQDGTVMQGRGNLVPRIRDGKYRVLSPQIIDITADGILDLCLEKGGKVQCHIGFYDAGINKFSERIFGSESAIYLSIPDADEKSSANTKKDANNDVSLGFRFVDVNGDALLDYCYYSDNSYQCAFNNEEGFVDTKTVLSFSSDLNNESIDALLSGIHIADINGDGYQDLCSQYNTGQYCAYNKGGSFYNLERRLGFVVDSDVHLQKVKVFDNWLRARFNESTKHYFFSSVSVYSAPLFANDLNSDEKGEFCTRTVNGMECYSNHHAQPVSLLTEVESPLGAKTLIEYSSASSKDIYTATDDKSITPKSLLVDTIQVDSGVDDQSGNPIYNHVEYRYFDLSYDEKSGKTLFSEIERFDKSANRKMISQFYTVGELAGQERRISDYNNDILISQRVNNIAVSDVLGSVSKRVNTLSTESTEYDPVSKQVLRTAITEYKSVDELGYPKITVVTTQQNAITNTITTTSDFRHNLNNWILAKPTNIVVTHNLTSTPEITKTVSFDYFDNGTLKYEVIEPDSDMKLKTAYQYYDDGTVKNTTVTGKVDATETQSRTLQYEYNAIGQLLNGTNELDQTSKQVYHARCGGVEYQYDIANRLIATNHYDDACRVRRTDMQDGSWSEVKVEWLSTVEENKSSLVSTAHSNAVYSVTKTSSNGSETISYFDRTGREIKSSNLISKNDSDTTKAIIYKNYNQHGQIEAVSRPVRSESTSEMIPEWIVNSYDDLGRASTITDISLDRSIRVATTTYDRFTITTAFDDFEKSVTSNILGKTQSISEDDKTVAHTYYSDGLLATTHHMGEKTIDITYDDRGHKKSMIDSASGTWSYKYNAFGELFWQQDAEKNVTTIDYDVLGRKKAEHLPEGTLSWNYYSSGNGIGHLHKEVGLENERVFTYDEKGRVDTLTLKIDGREIVTKQKYDAIGRNDQVVLNSAGSMQTPLYKGYNQGGKLQSYSMPASALKSFDFNGLEDDLTITLGRIKDLDALINAALDRVTVHENRALMFSAKADMYEKSLGGANQLIKSLRRKAVEHSKEATANYNVWKDYVKKSNGFSGNYAVRRFTYQGLKGNTHKFSYKGGCAKKVRKLGIFVRCSRYHYYDINLEKFEFNQLSTGTKNQKVCRENWSDFRISTGKSGMRINPKYSRGKYIRSTTKRVKYRYGKTGYRYKNETTKIYEWCKTKEYLPKDLYLEMANNYKVLYDKKKKYIAYAKKSETELAKLIKKRRNGQWYINGIPTTDYKGERPKGSTTTKSVAINNGGRFKEVSDNYRASNLSQLMAHYKSQFDHYSSLASKESGSTDSENDGLAKLRQQKTTKREEYDVLLRNVQKLGSLNQLKSLAENQAELINSDAKLVVWSALNWHTDGRLKDEIYGNGLRTIREFDHATGGLNSITTQNADNNVLANINYEFNARGYVKSIEDSISGYTDTFNYDGDMLDDWSRDGHGKSYGYDYQYDDLDNLTHKQSDTELNSFADINKPYQVTNHKSQAVGYDKKGFVTSAKGATYDWNSYGKSERIVANGKVTTFDYDAGKSRVKRVDSSGTTYYVMPGYEQVVKNNGDIVHRIHIRNGYETVATMERYEYATDGDASRPVDFASYYHRDMLGSGVLVTGSKAEILNRKGYTPYGEALPDYMLLPSAGMTKSIKPYAQSWITKARAATYQTMSSGASATRFKSMVAKAEQVAELSLSDEELKLLSRALTVNSVIDGIRGFTGHEMLEDSQLVHMNARLYDPEMGRFMTPDSIVPDANKPQAYNRYSYVYNNPASYSDPSGHNPLALAAIYFIAAHTYSDSQFHQTLSSVLLAAATWGAVEPTTVAGAAATAGGTTLVTSAALSGRISGTELRAAALSAVAAGVAFKIGSVELSDNDWAYKVMHHGAAQGAIGWVRNKNFWGSALAGAAGHASGVAMEGAGLLDGVSFGDVAARTAISATFGGLASAATGGEFAQGAMTAAIVHLYNSESHSCPSSICQSYQALYDYYFDGSDKSVTQEFTTGATDGVMLSHRAPHEAELIIVLEAGFQPSMYPGDGVYLTVNALEAGQYANAYGAGVLAVSTPVSVFESLSAQGHILPDKLVPGAFNVLPSGIRQFNSSSSIHHVPPQSFKLYDEYGAQ